jgi:hypothetical protein
VVAVQRFMSRRHYVGAVSQRGRQNCILSAFIPIALLLFALAVRFIAIDWHGAHADEHPAAAAKVLTGQLIDDFMYYPPLLNYCTAILFAGYFLLGKLVGYWSSTEDFRLAFFSDRAPFYVLLRAVTATWAALVAPLVYWLALRLGQARWTAAVAGIVAGTHPGERLLCPHRKVGQRAGSGLSARVRRRAAPDRPACRSLASNCSWRRHRVRLQRQAFGTLPARPRQSSSSSSS